MDIEDYAKSYHFIKLIDRGLLWEVHMESMRNKAGQFVDLEGNLTRGPYYIKFFKKKRDH